MITMVDDVLLSTGRWQSDSLGERDIEVMSTNLSSGSKTDRALNCRVTERLLTGADVVGEVSNC